jgi:integrase
MAKTPTNANRVLSAVRKMFNMAEVWGMRSDGSNPCRHIPNFPERGKTRLITDAELKRLYAYLNKAEAEGLEHPFILLAVRLQFEFAARMSEILKLEWAWIDFDNHRVEWPDSKTSGMAKPMSAEAVRLLEAAPRLEKSPLRLPIHLRSQPADVEAHLLQGLAAHTRACGAAAHRHTRYPASLRNRYRKLRNPREGRHGAHGAQDGHDVHALRPHRG